MNEQSHRVDGGVKGETAVTEQYRARLRRGAAESSVIRGPPSRQGEMRKHKRELAAPAAQDGKTTPPTSDRRFDKRFEAIRQ
jgi:hypothetical protein